MHATRWMCLCLVLVVGVGVGVGTTHAQTAAPAATPAAQSARPGDVGQSWQIQFERTAKSDGAITFRLWPYGADPIDLVLPVAKGDTENKLARETRDLLREKLDNTEYRINMARRSVQVTAIRGERRFALELASSTAEGVDIDLYREGR